MPYDFYSLAADDQGLCNQKSTSTRCIVLGRVEFSKPNIEISVTVTNASKFQSVGWLQKYKLLWKSMAII